MTRRLSLAGLHHADRARPRDAAGARAPRAPAPRSAVYAIALGRLDAAVASSCGSQHAVNEDAHSALDGTRPRCSSSPTASAAARWRSWRAALLVAQLHAALDGAPRRRRRVARGDARRRPRDRRRDRRASPRGPARRRSRSCAPLDAFASRWLVAWVGDCRVYRCVERAATARSTC